DRVLYLTFDDGPHPEVTPWVLEQLKHYNAKATFFCVGDNVQKYPDTFAQLTEEGHSLGNHTFNHLNGWMTDNLPYFHNVRHCARLINSGFFRPPYGRLKPKQVQFLQRHYQIVMWDVLSGDFDTSIDGQQCFRNVAQNAGPGSIVVFHDSQKARKNMMDSLPKVLEHFHQLGYRFDALQLQGSDASIKAA
ncbi:MAG: polysaccharide deacetylase family protein, partial [Bacteroidota bacterium]